MKLLTVASLIAASNSKDISLTWLDCGGPDALVKINEMTPDHLTLGKTGTVTGTGVLGKDVPDA